MKTQISHLAAVAALGLATFNLAACTGGSSSDSTKTVVVTSATAQADSLMTSISLQAFARSVVSVYGDYGPGCQRPGAGETTSDLWAVTMDGHDPADGVPAPTTNPLKIVSDDGDCVPHVLGFSTVGDRYTGSVSLGQTFNASPGMFTSVYNPSSAAVNGIIITTDNFESNFGLQLTFSELQTSQTEDNYAYRRVTTFSVTSGDVATPDVTVDTTSISVEVNNADVIVATSGHGTITPDSNTDDFYAIVAGDLTNAAYAAVDSAYDSSQQRSLIDTNGDLDPDDLTLVGGSTTDGPVIRSLIFAHFDADTSITSYEVVVLRFFGESEPP